MHFAKCIEWNCRFSECFWQNISVATAHGIWKDLPKRNIWKTTDGKQLLLVETDIDVEHIHEKVPNTAKRIRLFTLTKT